ncbi:NACHT domain-containing protein [Photobacterium damselae]|uniref:NACHT N-terminal Helical domain 1-containing protein n=1 Tax=Photobacterium damselae TaxID=38293 RepID=UPI000E03ED4B|nr:NACHT domain-containing protein [Photobacterium damselae]SUB66535.1 Predicted NTPase (NACHT family) [Photobacterium damselae]
MAVYECLLSLTTVLCKTGFKMIVGDNLLAQEGSSELVDLIRKKIPSTKQQRQVTRLFDSIAEEAADSLQKLEKLGEFKLKDNEKNAAIFAVELTFQKANLNLDNVIQNNLDPVKLELEILKSGKCNYNDLSSAGQSYFDALFRDSCAIAVEIVKTVPGLGVLLHGETLKRIDEILNSIEMVFEQLSNSSVSIEEKDKEFETRYLRAIASKLSSYSLFGLDVDSSLKKIDLDVSYISLSAEISSDGDVEHCEIENILSQHKRAIISGSPGSGKTTLVHWIGLMAAKRTFPNQLSNWNNGVPFIIPLRRYSERELPNVKEFIDFASKIYSDVMPDGWVSRLLQAGKAIVLIDGLDEVAQEKRDETFQWLSELIFEFPNCSYIITSRPNALTADWFDAYELAHVELQPMTPQNISMFIDHWHSAASQAEKESYTRDELVNFKKRLKAQINENARLRNMASSPLLCAMLCALNVDRNAILPQERGELYKIVMEVLLERRDSERKVCSYININVTRAQKELLLQNLAYWMLLNNKQTVTICEAEECFQRAIRMIPSLNGMQNKVARYLLDRSSVIRESSVGYVDFIHKTFSEYLAAKYIVDENSIELLVENAHLDAWKEVVVMASMHTSLKQSNNLIELLIEKGNEDEEKKYTLHLLSVVAKESTLQLAEPIVKRVDDILQTLLPPRDSEAVISISATGEFVVPYLRYSSSMSSEEQSLSVRTLTLIGGASSIDAISSYCNSHNSKTTSELINCWEYFDQVEYAEKVIGNLSDVSILKWPFRYSLDGVEHLDNITKLVVDGLDPSDSYVYDKLNGLGFNSISFRDCRKLQSLDCISKCIAVSVLDIDGCDDLKSLDSLVELRELKRISIKSCNSLNSIPHLKDLKNITEVNLEGNVELTDLNCLSFHKTLRFLNIDGCPGISDLSPLSTCTLLESIQTDDQTLRETLPEKLHDLLW